jgi:hypothetical protein
VSVVSPQSKWVEDNLSDNLLSATSATELEDRSPLRAWDVALTVRSKASSARRRDFSHSEVLGRLVFESERLFTDRWKYASMPVR